MTSKALRPVVEQGELILTRCAEPNGVPIEMIHRQKTPGAAFALACSSSGLEDKETGRIDLAVAAVMAAGLTNAQNEHPALGGDYELMTV